MSIKPSDVVTFGIGLMTGEAVADALNEESPVASIAAGFVAGGIGTSVARSVLRETGVSDVIDDIFDIF